MKRLFLAALAGGTLFTVGCDTKGPSSEELVFRSELYNDLNNVEKSELWARKAVDADQSNPDAWRALGTVWVRRGNLDSAISYF